MSISNEIIGSNGYDMGPTKGMGFRVQTLEIVVRGESLEGGLGNRIRRRRLGLEYNYSGTALSRSEAQDEANRKNSQRGFWGNLNPIGRSRVVKDRVS